MSFISSLRQLVDFQQYAALKQSCQAYYDETSNIEVLPLLAIANIHLNEWEEAKAIIVQLEAQLPELNTDACIDIAAVYGLSGRIAEALDLLGKAEEIDDSNSLLLARLAWCYNKQNKTEQAHPFYQKSASITPERLPVWLALVRLELQQQKVELAQKTLNEGIAHFENLYPHLPELVTKQFTLQFRSLQLELWVNSGNYEEAEAWLEKRKDDLPEDDWIELVNVYSNFLAGMSLLDEAESYLQAVQKQHRKSSGLFAQRAELAHLQGRVSQATQLLRRAISLANNDSNHEIKLYLRMASFCLHAMPDKAKKSADKALEIIETMQVSEQTPAGMIEKLQLQTKSVMAQVASHAQDFTLAETLFNEILTENSYFLPALQGLGHQKMQLGHIEQAIALFERIKEIDPVRGEAALINARRFPSDEATLNYMENTAREPSIEGKIRAGMLLQIATAREKNKDYDQAFLLAQEANEAYKKRLSYDPVDHRDKCARIRFAFGKSFFEHRKNYGSSSTVPVFVLGMPRSGTTLVEQILASHTDIFGAGELGIIPSKTQGINRWERHIGSGRRYPDCVDDLSEVVSKRIADNILEELRELCVSDKPDAKHVIDKLPHNFENIGLIKFLFPNAKIISVRRDPRDIAISNFFTDYQAKHGGMGFSYDLTWIGEQLADHNLMMHHWQTVFPNEILEVKYEDVIADVAGQARRMLNYIGVPWEEQVVAFNELDRAVKTASVWQVRQPVYKTSKAKWLRYKDYLSPLIKGTNAKITAKPIDDMLSLPEPGLLNKATMLFKSGDLDGAELAVKKMLHHNETHGACNYILALIYCRKGHVNDALPLFELAHQQCKWKKDWSLSLIKAYEELGETEKAEALQAKLKTKTRRRKVKSQQVIEAQIDDNELDSEQEGDDWLLDDMDDNQF